MGFWVQYHNLDRNNGYMPHGGQYGYEGELCVNTSIEGVAEAEGDTIFLIVGHEDRSDCLLWARFVCKGIEPYNMGGYKWEVFGTGWTLVRRGSASPPLLNRMSGFAEFRQSCNGFRRFQEISHLPFLNTLLNLSDRYKPSRGAPEPPVKTPVNPPNLPPITSDGSISKATKSDPQPAVELTDLPPDLASNGGGFGVSGKNQQVEKAAIDAVQRDYEARGWVVESVEHENRGYDLVCCRGKAVEHVEVKGVSGRKLRFIITEGEVRRAKEDSSFVLWVVTAALVRPVLQRYSRDEFLGGFSLTPKDYWATLK